MIAAVSVGLSIDGSIHYLHTYQVSQAKGHTARGSLQRAQRSTGLAISIATVALALGLLTLATSPLKPTATFGLLSGITLLAGLAGNLVLLPALIVLLEKRNRLRRGPNPKSIE
jgi:predicted RND superfamily exporter protein